MNMNIESLQNKLDNEYKNNDVSFYDLLRTMSMTELQAQLQYMTVSEFVSAVVELIESNEGDKITVSEYGIEKSQSLKDYIL